MLVQEMHIGVDIGVQKLNTDVLDNISPEQKDWILNEAQLRFIKNRVNPKSNPKNEGFDDTAKRIEDLEDLHSEVSKQLFIKDDITQFFELPQNYFLPIEGWCDVSCTNVSKQQSNIVNLSTFVFPLLNDYSVTPFSNFKITLNTSNGDIVLFDINDYAFTTNANLGVLHTTEERFYLVSHILSIINKLDDISIYWENYDNEYKPNMFTLVTNNQSITLTISDYNGNRIHPVVNKTRNIYLTNLQTTRNIPARQVVSKIRRILAHPFLTTVKHSPIYNISNKVLNIYHNEKFILSKFNFLYIRKPRLISLSLNQSCEINTNFHEEIVDIAVQLIKSRIEAKDYKNIINENLLKE